MARFEVNQNALSQIGRRAVDNFNKKMQPVLDSVFDERGEAGGEPPSG